MRTDTCSWAEVTATGESKSSQSIFLTGAEERAASLPSSTRRRPLSRPARPSSSLTGPVDPTTQSPPNFQILVAQKDKPTGRTE